MGSQRFNGQGAEIRRSHIIDLRIIIAGMMPLQRRYEKPVRLDAEAQPPGCRHIRWPRYEDHFRSERERIACRLPPRRPECVASTDRVSLGEPVFDE